MKIFCQNCGSNLKAGILICPDCGFENKIPGASNKTKLVIIVLIFIALATGAFVFLVHNNQIKLPFLRNEAAPKNSLYEQYLSEKPKCNFEITDLKELRIGGDKTKTQEVATELMRFQSSQNMYVWSADPTNDERFLWEEENYRWFLYEGVIRNKSSNKQYLNEMIAKIYTADGIFLGQGWGRVDSDSQYTSARNGIWLDSNIAIPFKVGIKFENGDLIKKYIDTNLPLKPSVYPWFDTCN